MDTTTNISMWISRFTTICHNAEGVHDIKCSQKQLVIQFCKFERIGSNFIRDSNRRCSIKKRVLKDFAIVTGKYLCQRLFLSYNFNKKETPVQGFSCELCNFFSTTPFSQNPSGRLIQSFHFKVKYRN